LSEKNGGREGREKEKEENEKERERRGGKGVKKRGGRSNEGREKRNGYYLAGQVAAEEGVREGLTASIEVLHSIAHIALDRLDTTRLHTRLERVGGSYSTYIRGGEGEGRGRRRRKRRNEKQREEERGEGRKEKNTGRSELLLQGLEGKLVAVLTGIVRIPSLEPHGEHLRLESYATKRQESEK